MFMFMNMSKYVLFGIVFIALSLSHAVFADEVTDSINEALEAYNEGEYSEAVESLNYASQLISQKKAENLSSLLPDPLDGWKETASTSNASGAAIFGGGITAVRNYVKGSNNISIEIMADSPLLQSAMMMLSNPMYATSGGGKLEKIKRQKAIVKFESGADRGEIQIVVAKRFLVTVKGNRTTLDDLKAYAKAIDYKRLKKLE